MATTADFRNGLVIEFNGELWTIVEFQHVKPGKGPAFVRTAETETPIACEMPATVVLEVTYTEPGERGNTATNTFKDAKLETGAIVKVPLFINIGDKIKVDTRTHEYSERVKV